MVRIEQPAALSVPAWKGHSSLCPASPSMEVEATIVKAAKFFQSAAWFSYGGVHICLAEIAVADMSWGAVGEEKKMDLLCWFCF